MQTIKDTDPFPIQQDSMRDDSGRMIHLHRSTIPWWLAEEAFKIYHNHWPSQSLQELADRGGFGRQELLKLLRNEF